MVQITTFVILLAFAALAHSVSNVIEFRRLINKSRASCRATCFGARTVAQITQDIPGGRTTVRPYAGFDLMKTYDLCVSRESGGSDDWKTILSLRTRFDAGATRRDEVFKECDAQIKKEKKDCAALKEMLCAFSQGTDFSCAVPRQKKRTAETLTNDQCFHLSAIADDRPDTLAQFNTRLRKSKTNCRKDKDKILDRCRGERTLESIMRQVPKGVNTMARAGTVRSELRMTIQMCLDREDIGFAEFRRQTHRVLLGAANREVRTRCLAQIRDEMADCTQAKKIVCAFTYGIDFSCAPTEQKRGSAAHNDCDRVEQAIKANGING